ncbi:MAG: methylmalonyl-CoA mutase [Deltaproteobacteria bacterium]|nr:methylmalonyl-CoA mutase [Deltaproteobacteria bacterium]
MADPKTPELPGAFPFTRGIHASMYTKKLWTMRQYAGFGDAKASNERYRYLLSQGITGLSIAFDLPTQMGYDSDHAMARGEVGRVGVAISSLDDMGIVLDGIDLATVSTSMTINSTASILLAFYLAVAEKQGVAPNRLRGTIQNDVLKEYIARGTYVFPPGPSLKITADIIEFCKNEVPEWNTISISGYHIREAGSTAVQEVAFTLANGLAYVQTALDRGLKIDEFAPRLSFFFNVHNDFCEEIAKFRAARRLWAKLIEERFSPKDQKSLMLRFHAQTAGSTLIAQDVDSNVCRVTLQCMAAVLGGAQSIHTNSRDEALGLPTVESATLALRTQQVIAYESGVANNVDPFGGADLIEKTTDMIEREARQLIEVIESKGGVVACLQAGYQQDCIQSAAYQYQQEIENKTRIIVGQNRFNEGAQSSAPVLKIEPRVEIDQVARLMAFKKKRKADAASKALIELDRTARENRNLMPPILAAVKAHVTLGEITETLVKIYGRHH